MVEKSCEHAVRMGGIRMARGKAVALPDSGPAIGGTSLPSRSMPQSRPWQAGMVYQETGLGGKPERPSGLGLGRA